MCNISQEQTGFEVIYEENSRYFERKNKLIQPICSSICREWRMREYETKPSIMPCVS